MMQQKDELLKVEQGRGGRCLFSLAAPAAADIARALQAAIGKEPSAFQPHIVRLMERIRAGQPLTLGDTSQIFKIRSYLEGLSSVGERALSVLEPAMRDAHQRTILRTSYFRSSPNEEV